MVPHPDDEVLIAGGLIQRVIKDGGKVKIVYLTIGDRSIGSVVRMDKSVKLAPTEFLSLGEKRHDEALTATSVLGIKPENLVFLGFPDGGLEEVLVRDKNDERGPVVSRSTKLDHVPYSWAYQVGQSYFEEELVGDLTKIIEDFNPTMLVTTYPRDNHPDHRAAFEVIEKIKTEKNFQWPFYAALVHYKNYPANGDYLFPPKKVFSDRWEALELMDSERKGKIAAIEKYASQLNRPDHGWYLKFAAKNEIFEAE